MRHVRAGGHAALTVDGPRGPAREVQSGIVGLALLPALARPWLARIAALIVVLALGAWIAGALAERRRPTVAAA